MRERPWSTVLRVPVADGLVWFKACSAVQAFEPRLTAALASRWPRLLPEVVAHDEERRWLLLADAGTRIADIGNPPEGWLAVLPEYAELQHGEAVHVEDHLDHGVPDLRVATLPAEYDVLLSQDLPVAPDERERLRTFAVPFADHCRELAAHEVPESVQHDDLHMNNVFVRGSQLRVLDWGDASISHPFASLVATFRLLEERNGLAPGDPWYARLRDAYLEPWGSGHTQTFETAMRVGVFAHAIAALRQRAALAAAVRASFDLDLAVRLHRALRTIGR